MSDAEGEEREPSFLSVGGVDDPDIVLRVMIHLAETRGKEFPITLMVAGLLVSGHICSSERLFQGVSGSEEVSGDTKGVFESLLEFSRQPDRAVTGVPHYAFLHLRDARIFGAGLVPLPTEQSTWLRVRVKEVEGFLPARVGTQRRRRQTSPQGTLEELLGEQQPPG